MLNGRTVVVIGGTGAVGSAVVEFAVRSGARVVASHSASRTAPAASGSLSWGVVDATVEDSVRTFFGQARGTLGTINVVVNTVGGYAGGDPVASLTTETWDRMMSMNLRSAFLVLRSSLQAMSGQPFGRIIQIAALSALEPSERSAAYAVSKAAMVHLAEIAARETSGTNITINSIAPKIIDTPENRAWAPTADHSTWVHPSEICRVIDWLCDPSTTRSGTTIRLPSGAV